MDLKIGIICSDGAHHNYLIKYMSQYFDLSFVVIEPGSAQVERIKKRKKYYDYVLARYNILRRRICGHTRERKDYFKLTDSLSPPACDVLKIDNINDPRVINLVQNHQPDYVISMGVSIIKQELLSAMNGRAINIHGGYLPDYKGNHCFFFALLNGDFDHIGTTLHYIDEGVDTGSIIGRVCPDFETTDAPETIYNRAEKLAIHRLAKYLGEEHHESLKNAHTQATGIGKTYRTRDRTPLQDLRYALIRLHRLARNRTIKVAE